MKMHTENAEPGKCRTENTNNEFHVGLWLRRNVNCILLWLYVRRSVYTAKRS